MKKVMVQSIVGLLAIFLSACSAASQATNGPINPGDQVGDFVFSTADEKIAGVPHNYTCTENGNDLACKTTAGTRVNISPSFYDDTSKVESKNFGQAAPMKCSLGAGRLTCKHLDLSMFLIPRSDQYASGM